MELDANLLARLQFAFTVSFHIVFPAFSIGISAYVATLLLLWSKTGAERYHRLARFWTKIFAVSFAMGVVSGIVLSYQFGTNWSRFSEVVGNVIGPLIGYEVLTAFFLEATFLGIMLFGWERVPPWLHVMASCIVAFGTAVSGFWILSANSWMHTPAGFEMRNGIAYPVDWLKIIFNPSFPYRFAHMMTAAYLTTAVVVLSVGCRYLLAGKFGEDARTMVRMAVGMIFVVAPLQAFIGDEHGLNTLEHQPVKVAAMEGHWDGDEPVALSLFGIPNSKTERNDYEISIPRISGLILTHQWDGRIKGLKDFAKEDRPPLISVFFGFRLMVAIGFLFIGTGIVGAWLWWKDQLWEARWFQYGASFLWPLGFVAILSGWIVTETGRQPWVATGVLRTADAMSPVSVTSLAISLTLFVLVYFCVFSMGVYYINRLINRGPEPKVLAAPGHGQASRPLSAAEDAVGDALGAPARGLTAMGMEQLLPLAWAGIIGAAVAMYVILDGFDLGIGILFPLTQDERERDQMMNTVAPFWDGNETWLVLGGGGLWVAFPKAYAVIMPAVYLPVIVMLLALIFRGVSFEFRWLAKPNKSVWNVTFALGSAVAAFCQGLILGALIQGVHVEQTAHGAQFAGGSFDWLTLFSVLCGFGVLFGYALLGATWLILKTDGEVAIRSREQAKLLLMLTLGAMALVSLWTPLSVDRIWERWFSYPNILFLWWIPLVTGAVALMVWKTLEGAGEIAPFIGSILLFLLGFLGLAISVYPYLVPPHITFWDAAAAPESQIFMGAGTLVMFPVILGYTVFVYWLFRGKVRAGEGYH